MNQKELGFIKESIQAEQTSSDWFEYNSLMKKKKKENQNFAHTSWLTNPEIFQ